jgi:hypothetical protein
MIEGQTAILIFVSLSVVCAVISHAFVRRYWRAAVIAALVTSLLLQIVNTIHLGHLDPFAPIAFIFGVIYAFVIGMLVGLPFQHFRQET